eukprot:GHVP01053645.1.p1 GENE.GHVP01053645.1~~GHVP01053645.1.p1  ORF type:complete len:513 (+),score=95.34 GHVP01053645.1:25-1539(+)
MDLDSILAYVKAKEVKSVFPSTLPDKGRVLIANADFESGEVLFVEPPLREVSVDTANPIYRRLVKLYKKENFDLKPLWYWCALNSLILENEENEVTDDVTSYLKKISSEDQQRVTDLFAPGEEQPSSDVLSIVEEFNLKIDPMKLETLLQVWVYNSFEHSDDPLGYAMYYLSSFCSHSCDPNCVWFLDEEENFVLRCRRPLQKGVEITLSYLSEEDLFEPTFLRRNSMQSTKSFWCTCSRCSEDLDTCRSIKCQFCSIGFFCLPSTTDPFDSTFPCQNCGSSISGKSKDRLLKSEKRMVAFARKILQHERGSQGSSDEGEGEEIKFLNSNVSLDIEDPVESILQFSSNLSDAPKKTIEIVINKLFPNHWVALQWYSYKSKSLSEEGDYQSQIRCIRNQLEILDKIFVSPNGHRGWLFEGLGDTYLKMLSQTKLKGTKEEVLEILKIQEQSLEAFKRSRECLCPLFGNYHEYTTAVDTKVKNLNEVVKKYIDFSQAIPTNKKALE